VFQGNFQHARVSVFLAADGELSRPTDGQETALQHDAATAATNVWSEEDPRDADADECYATIANNLDWWIYKSTRVTFQHFLGICKFAGLATLLIVVTHYFLVSK